MSAGVLKAVKDWCNNRFQSKGNYLTEVPDEYVTETKLAEKNYATRDELPGDAGMTAESVNELINSAFLENTCGAKIAQDAEGNWGLMAPGADTVVPFRSGNGEGSFEGFDVIGLGSSSSTQSTSIINGGFNTGALKRGYKKILFMTTFVRGNKLKNYPRGLTYSINSSQSTYEIEENWNCDNFSDNEFAYYKMLLSNGAADEGMNISVNYSLELSQTDTTAKTFMQWVVGFY